MRITTVLKAAAVALAVLAMTTSSVAQEDTRQLTGSDFTSDGVPIVKSLAFEGGSLESFVEALRKAVGNYPMNIICSPEAAGLPVAPLSLQQVDAYTALRSVSQWMQITPMFGEDRSSIRLNIDRIGGGAAPVYSIEVVHAEQPQQMRLTSRGDLVAAVEQYTVVHSITELTTGNGAMSADDVLSALQAALAMEDAEDVKLAYHEETGLIFARVTNDQGQVIENTIMNLRVSREAKRENEQRSTTQSILHQLGVESVNEAAVKLGTYEAMQTEFIRLKDRIVELEQQLRAVRDELNQARSH